MLGYDVFTQLDFLLRIFIAGICGAMIGYERKSRLKEAGIRTHFIVALASSLMMVLSKYCFTDVLKIGLVGLDPSRIASTVVSGIGFLGAGMIFVRRHTINGLTTAAGIWATAGVGMSVGAGFYFLGIASTAIILFAQVVLRNNLWIIKKIPEHENIRFVILNNHEVLDRIKETFEKNGIDVLNLHMENSEKSTYITIDLDIKIQRKFNSMDFAMLFKDMDGIKSIDL